MNGVLAITGAEESRVDVSAPLERFAARRKTSPFHL